MKHSYNILSRLLYGNNSKWKSILNGAIIIAHDPIEAWNIYADEIDKERREGLGHAVTSIRERTMTDSDGYPFIYQPFEDGPSYLLRVVEIN